MYLQSNQYDQAIDAYKECVVEIIKEGENVDKQIAAIVFSNLGLSYFKNKDYIQAEVQCTESIKFDPNYYKAYVRRAEARKRLKKELDAVNDYQRAQLLKPEDKSIQKKLISLERKIESIKRQILQGMVKRRPYEQIESVKVQVVDVDESGKSDSEDFWKD